ncbi:hypothetical protein, conserved in T. vivax [Trypanosoma vivax Y486]|uniref:Uncharacterized protein n=1 Tax=Trypanosoma vivax (strain Y486) TaxID=1055687 RepID=F9WW05_TRYVY|nr:hypothetical protein, conserved in T. vivax [Trypanosoma vivax Y486]|eukprot:CCD21772.1 hypothetical protein, conserved in T. vivax [Trypanosoma vivax Y486]
MPPLLLVGLTTLLLRSPPLDFLIRIPASRIRVTLIWKDVKAGVILTLQNELTGCTYENYTLERPRNITITAVNDIVTLGEDGMLILGAGYSFKMYSTAFKTCPFLLEEFLLEGGKTMAWGGFWTMKVQWDWVRLGSTEKSGICS